jgi:predicted DNA-binding transcriptional regulator YafY
MSKEDAQVRRYRIFQLLCLRDEDTAMTETEVYQALLAEGYAMSKKTVQRDLTKFMDKFKLLETGTYPNRYYADKNNYNPEIELALTKEQLFTVVVALDTLKSTSPALIEKICNDALLTIGDTIPDELKEAYSYFKMVSKTQEEVGGKSVAQDEEAFHKVFENVINGYAFKCHIVKPFDQRPKIKDPDDRKWYYPIYFTFTNNIPYVFVYDLNQDIFRMPRMTRLVNIETQHKHEDRKALEKKARKNYKKSFSGFIDNKNNNDKYEIFCDEMMATYFAEKPLSQNQKIDRILQDKYKITFELNRNNQISRLLAGFGGHIESIKPDEVSKEVIDIWSKSYKKAA